MAKKASPAKTTGFFTKEVLKEMCENSPERDEELALKKAKRAKSRKAWLELEKKAQEENDKNRPPYPGTVGEYIEKMEKRELEG